MGGKNLTDESMLDMYLFETSQNIEQLETSILHSEKESCYTPSAINEIFRIIHTIKGSSTMMLFNSISNLAHVVEDLFFFLREQKPQDVDAGTLSDFVLEGIDFIKIELQKIRNGDPVDGDPSVLIEKIKEFLLVLKQENPSSQSCDSKAKEGPVTEQKQQYFISPDSGNKGSAEYAYRAKIFFEDGCDMENIRAYTVVHNLKEYSNEIRYFPEDIIDNDDCVQIIRQDGFTIFLRTDKNFEEMNKILTQSTAFMKDMELIQLDQDSEEKHFNVLEKEDLEEKQIKIPDIITKDAKDPMEGVSAAQSIISVNVPKLDKLMDLVGEMVIAEAMVVQNPDLMGLELDNFQKAARQLRKITSELQDIVMSIRMVPLSTTFHKMHRVVRDMSKKLGKEVQLHLVGEDTEVDKNIIEHISDPLMHLVRNSLDHGIEGSEERIDKGKSKVGNLTLEAKNIGNDVLVIIKDDGRGLSREKILKKARENGLLHRPENEMTEKEIYNLIFLPGFSTKEVVSEFSGRGVGMDVVTKNIATVGGTISIESKEDIGSVVTLKIPLTLAIIDGMNVRVGNSRYTIPTTTIKQSFRPKESDIICDPEGNEMIMVRGDCFPLLRLHEIFKVKTDITQIIEGILIMVEQDEKGLCLFADELLGQQQVVVKELPKYLRDKRNSQGIGGCTLLGNGSVSLILDITKLLNYNDKG
ncbi:MAG: chemotaxis protein CheA [Peptococcaceae bacterium]|nr:chemotaxis protein CheA [Peptococcaceae bacterium]